MRRLPFLLFLLLTGATAPVLAQDPTPPRIDSLAVEGNVRVSSAAVLSASGLATGQVTVGKGFADEENLEVGDTIQLEGPSGDREARVAGIVETVLFSGQTVGMSLATMRDRVSKFHVASGGRTCRHACSQRSRRSPPPGLP